MTVNKTHTPRFDSFSVAMRELEETAFAIKDERDLLKAQNEELRGALEKVLAWADPRGYGVIEAFAALAKVKD